MIEYTIKIKIPEPDDRTQCPTASQNGCMGNENDPERGEPRSGYWIEILDGPERKAFCHLCGGEVMVITGQLVDSLYEIGDLLEGSLVFYPPVGDHDCRSERTQAVEELPW